jgi:hypothetical protein
MAKNGSKNPTPLGLRNVPKGAHSEKNTSHKACWYGLNLNVPTCPTDNNGKERKMSLPYIPPCVPW